MAIWRFRFTVSIEGSQYQVHVRPGWLQTRVCITSGGAALAEDVLSFYDSPYRIQQLALPSPHGDLLFEIAPRTRFSYGLRVSRGSVTLHQSHDDPFAYVPRIQTMLARRASDSDDVDLSKLKRNLPALATDIALGLLFFVLAKYLDLRTAALATAAAGLSIYVLQWVITRFFKSQIDLLGGLAMFGIVMLLLSAGFSWWFDSELAVQMKSTWIGLLGAAFFALDAWRGAPYLGKRLAMYVAYRDIDTRRLAWSFAAVGATMALVNAFIALTFSKDTWLWYTLWGDAVLAFVLSAWAIQRARSLPRGASAP